MWIRPGVSNETFGGIDKHVLLKVWDDPARQPGDNVIVGDVFACEPDGDSFDYPDFSSTVGLTAAGDAALDAEDPIYNLIPFDKERAGAVWTTEKKAVVRGFTVEFTVRPREGGSPATASDGFSFVV